MLTVLVREAKTYGSESVLAHSWSGISLDRTGHLCRLAFRWEVVLAGWAVPFAVSWAASFIFAYLAYAGLRLSKQTPQQNRNVPIRSAS